jgi:dTDP-4-dehydrorhamnose reductase
MTEKHIVLGSGNLGHALKAVLGERAITQPSGSWRFPADKRGLRAVLDFAKPSTVWCAVGGGSIDWADKNREEAKAALLDLPLFLMDVLPLDTRLVLFSTDYVAHEAFPSKPTRFNQQPGSFYAELKLFMELTVSDFAQPNVRVVRVSNLYGPYKPERNLASKIRANVRQLPATVLEGDTDTIPSVSCFENEICPTPVDLLAHYLRENEELLFSSEESIHHCAPNGSMSIVDFAVKVLEPGTRVYSIGQDPKRPRYSRLGCSFGHGLGELECVLEDYPA